MTSKHKAVTLVNELTKHLNRSTIFGGKENASEVRPPLFNGAVTRQPLARIECSTVTDIQRALNIAESNGVPISILGGRHDPFERAIQDGALVLDLRRMSKVHFNPEAHEVTVQGGATTGDLLNGLPGDVVTVTGTIKTIGVVGLTLGGGYGCLNSRLGLAIDVMKSAEMVLADGSSVIASDAEDVDLFWAIRGGGTGFGVVTSMTLATHQIPKVLSGTILFPLSAAKRAILEAQHMLDEFPDDLSILSVFTTAASGGLSLFLLPLWSGDTAEGERLMQRITKLDGAQVVKQGWSTYSDSFGGEEIWPWGRRYQCETQTVPRIDDAVAELLIEEVSKMTSPKSILFLHDLHGVPSRVANDATAFPLRTNHFVIGIVSAWDSDDDKDSRIHKVWTRTTSEALSQFALPGGYVNFLNPDDNDRVRQFYGASADRLLRTKARVDPHDRFRYSTGHFAL